MFKDKISSKDILNGFSYTAFFRKCEPVLFYDKAGVMSFLYNEYKDKQDFFSEDFKPEWDGFYPLFKEFNSFLLFNSKSHYSEFDIRVLPKFREGSFICLGKEEINLAKTIGARLESGFGCDYRGDKNLRTRIFSIPKEDIFIPGVGKF